MVALLALLLAGSAAEAEARPAPWKVTRAQLRNGTGLSRVRDASMRRMGFSPWMKQTIAVGRRRVEVMVKKPKHGSITHELAAYALSVSAGFHLVPPTLRHPEAAPGEYVQLFVKGRQVADQDDSPYTIVRGRDRLLDMHLFDYLIGNSDRHGGNWLVAGEGDDEVLVAIDHEMTRFSTELKPYGTYRSRMVLDDCTPTEAHRRFFEQIDLRRVGRALRSTGLAADKIAGVLLRIENIRGAYPSAASGRAAHPDGQVPAEVEARVRALVASLTPR